VAESRSTAPPEISIRRIRWARFLRRVFFLLICGILVAGAMDVFGPKSGEATGSGGGYELTVTYDERSRPGLATSLEVELKRDGGFPGSVAVSFTSDYFDILDLNGVDPEPLGGTSTENEEILYFEAPKTGDTMTIGFDARIQPDVQVKRVKATVTVLNDAGQPLALARIETLVMP
jgi:hypothetical protein